jgi:hypothetical protein
MFRRLVFTHTRWLPARTSQTYARFLCCWLLCWLICCLTHSRAAPPAATTLPAPKTYLRGRLLPA